MEKYKRGYCSYVVCYESVTHPLIVKVGSSTNFNNRVSGLKNNPHFKEHYHFSVQQVFYHHSEDDMLNSEAILRALFILQGGKLFGNDHILFWWKQEYEQIHAKLEQTLNGNMDIVQHLINATDTPEPLPFNKNGSDIHNARRHRNLSIIEGKSPLEYENELKNITKKLEEEREHSRQHLAIASKTSTQLLDTTRQMITLDNQVQQLQKTNEQLKKENERLKKRKILDYLLHRK